MPAVANIVLNDALAVPVAHTFIPLGPDSSGVHWFEDQSPADALGYNRISVELVRPAMGKQGTSSGQRVNRIKVGIHTPVLETLGTSDTGLIPPPTLAYVPRCNIEFIMSERASLQSRKDLRKYAQYVLADTSLVAVIEQLQFLF